MLLDFRPISWGFIILFFLNKIIYISQKILSQKYSFKNILSKIFFQNILSKNSLKKFFQKILSKNSLKNILSKIFFQNILSKYSLKEILSKNILSKNILSKNKEYYVINTFYSKCLFSLL